MCFKQPCPYLHAWNHNLYVFNPNAAYITNIGVVQFVFTYAELNYQSWQVLSVNVDSKFNSQDFPVVVSSGRAAPQFSPTSGFRVSSSDPAAASSWITAEPETHREEWAVKTDSYKDIRPLYEQYVYYFFNCGSPQQRKLPDSLES